MKRLVLTWEAVNLACLDLCYQIRSQRRIGAIAPVTRGGLLPASIAAYELDIPIAFAIDPRLATMPDQIEKAIRTEFDLGELKYDENGLGRLEFAVETAFEKLPEFITSVRRDLLIVDDVCDTGATFRGLRKFFPNALFAAPYAKPAGRDACDLSAVDVEQDTWIVMPWAKNDEVNR